MANWKLVSLYKLVDPETLGIRYIGQTTRLLKSRLQDHCECRSKTHTSCWIGSLKSRGLKPIIEEICRVKDQYADDLEIRLIAFYKSLGYRLTNHSLGGQSRRLISEDTKLKISLSLKGRMLGIPKPPRTEEHRTAIGASKKGKPWSLESRGKLSASRKGISTSLKGKPWSEARRLAQNKRSSNEYNLEGNSW